MMLTEKEKVLARRKETEISPWTVALYLPRRCRRFMESTTLLALAVIPQYHNTKLLLAITVAQRFPMARDPIMVPPPRMALH